MFSDFRLDPLTWRLESVPLALGALLLIAAASLGLPLGGYLLLTRRARRRPASWASAGAGSFAAGAAPRLIGPWSVVVGWMGGGALLVTERVQGTDRVRIASYDTFEWVSTAFFGLALAVVVLAVLLDRPRIVLDRDGIKVHRIGRPLHLRWDELVSSELPGRWEHLVVHRVGAGGPQPVKLPAGRLQVDPAFLAHTVRRCRDEPALRVAIGTAAGLTDLQTTFARL